MNWQGSIAELKQMVIIQEECGFRRRSSLKKKMKEIGFDQFKDKAIV